MTSYVTDDELSNIVTTIILNSGNLNRNLNRYEFCFSYDSRTPDYGKLFFYDNEEKDCSKCRKALCFGSYSEITKFRDEIRQFVSISVSKLERKSLDFCTDILMKVDEDSKKEVE